MDQGYGIMPNRVLYSKELTDKQKLLFCTISSLCAEKGYCRATNEFLGELLNADKRTISRNVSALEENGYIAVEIENNTQRKITLDKNVHGDRQKGLGGDRQKCPHNNTINKITKEQELDELKNRLENEYHLPSKVVELALTFDQYKAGTKIRKFEKGQLTKWVNKLKKDGLDCEEGMIMTLEKSIASGYQGTTPIRPWEIKKKDTNEIKIGDIDPEDGHVYTKYDLPNSIYYRDKETKMYKVKTQFYH